MTENLKLDRSQISGEIRLKLEENPELNNPNERKAPAFGINYTISEVKTIVSNFKRVLKTATSSQNNPELLTLETTLYQELGPAVVSELYDVVFKDSWDDLSSEEAEKELKKARSRVARSIREYGEAATYWTTYENPENKYSDMMKNIVLIGKNKGLLSVKADREDPQRTEYGYSAYKTLAHQLLFEVSREKIDEETGTLTFRVWPFGEEEDSSNNETAVAQGITLSREEMKESIRAFKEARKDESLGNLISLYRANLIISRELGEMAFWNLHLIAKLECLEGTSKFTVKLRELKRYAQKRMDLIIEDYFNAAKYWNSRDRTPQEYTDMMKDIVEAVDEGNLGVDVEDGFTEYCQGQLAAIKTLARQMGYRLGPQRIDKDDVIQMKIDDPRMDMVEKAFITEITS